MDMAVYGRSHSVTSMASPFAAAIDLATAGHLPSLPASGLGLGNKLLPPKPRGIDRRSASELLPSIYSGVTSCLVLLEQCMIGLMLCDLTSTQTYMQGPNETPCSTVLRPA